MNPFERPKFKKGAGRIYEELKINSGYVWPKYGIKIPNKRITISILPAIKSNLDKNDFLEILEKNIYNELDRIN